MIKNIRYIYWLMAEFFKQYKKILFITFLLTFVLITFILSSSSLGSFSAKKQKIGLVGQHNLNNPPDVILSLISNPLIYLNEKGGYQPVLASSWENFDNNKKFIITLRDNLYWNDNKKLTTSDINFKLKDVKIERLDERRIVFVLEKPLPIFLNYLTKPLLKNGLIGAAGAYRATNIKLRNGYLAEINLQPRISNLPPIKYLFFENEERMIQAYKKGEINKMTIKKKSLADNFIKWKNTKITKLVDYNHPVTIFFNLKDEKLADRELRNTLEKAINKSIFKEIGEVAYGPIPPSSYYFSQNTAIDIYSPELAQTYIKTHYQSTDSAQMKLTMITSYDFFDILDPLKKQFNDVNVGLDVKIVNRIPSENFSLLLTYWEVPSLDDQYFFWHSSQSESNLSNYQNVKIDKTLEDIRATTNILVKKKLATDFQKIFTDDPPAIFLYYPYIYLIERK